MILVGGENLIDFIQIESAEENPIYQANPGGSPYNCAKAVGRQQVPVSYLTPISTDSLGELLAKGLTDSGVTLCGIRRSEPSSLAVVSLKKGVASYQFYRQNTAERMVTLAGLNAGVPTDASAFHLGSLSLTHGEDAEVWTDFYIAMKNSGAFTSLDPNIRAAFITDRAAYLARFERLLAATDLLKLSDEDLAWLTPDVDLETAARQLLERTNAALLVVTLGGEGAFALAGGRKITIKAAPVAEMKDTVGAGDTFTATLLARLDQTGSLSADALKSMDGTNVTALLNRAAKAAALNCEKSGCNPPDLGELDTALQTAKAEK